MKYLLFTVLVVCSVKAAPSVLPSTECKTSSETRSLNDFFQGLVEMIPVSDILNVVLEAVNEDEEVMKAVVYLKSKEFRVISMRVTSMPQFKQFLQFISCLGVDVHFYMNSLIDFLKYPICPYDFVSKAEHRGGLKATMYEILQLLPMEDLREYYEEQLMIDDDLQAAMKAIGSPEFVQIGDAVIEMPEYKDFLRRLTRRGIEIDAIIEGLDEFFGWNQEKKKFKTSFIEDH